MITEYSEKRELVYVRVFVKSLYRVLINYMLNLLHLKISFPKSKTTYLFIALHLNVQGFSYLARVINSLCISSTLSALLCTPFALKSFCTFFLFWGVIKFLS